MNKLGLFFISIVSLNAWSFSNRCSTSHEGSVRSLCEGRAIPASRARNFHSNSQKLQCSSVADHYVRTMQRLPEGKYGEWLNMIDSGLRDDAFKLRTDSANSPDVKWRGVIPYQTVETWTWEDCELVTDGFRCGTHTETRRYDCSYQSCSTSGSGNKAKQSCRTVSKTCTENREVANTCYSDIEHSESWVCSNEYIKYAANFKRYNNSEWNPKTQGYKDPIPNKYDLLPGEVEDIQVFSNTNMSTVVNPMVQIGDAWNVYTPGLSGSAVGARCMQNSNYELNVVINTGNRITNKKTPNAFKLPLDAQGNRISALGYKPALGKDGKTQIQQGIPSKIRLMDTASSVVLMMAQQSRRTAEREGLKENLGQGGEKEKMTMDEQQKADPGFFKNTKVRIGLEKVNRFLFNTRKTKYLYSDDIQSIKANDNAFSDKEEISLADLWTIDLARGTKDGENVFLRKRLGGARNLRPGQDYVLNIQMFQKGLKDFYLQSCDKDSKEWDCKWYAFFFKRGEDDVYSEPLRVPFKVPEIEDQRSLTDKLTDFFW